MAGGPPGPPGAPGVPARKPCISHLSLQAADPTGCRKRCTCLLSQQLQATAVRCAWQHGRPCAACARPLPQLYAAQEAQLSRHPRARKLAPHTTLS